MKDKDTIGWYYKGVRDSLGDSLSLMKPYEEYCMLIKKNFG